MIWKYLGFERNIFFVEPLAPRKEDIELFVGRDEEIKHYLFDVFSDSRALKIVSGHIGVGKTTFVNACQYYSYIKKLPFEFNFEVPRVLPCFEKVQINEKDGLDDFIAKTIIAICQSIVHHCKLNSIDPPKKAKDILSYFLDLAIGSGGAGVSGGFNVLGTGLSFGKTSESTTPNILRNARAHLKELVKLTKEELGFQGVFITVNNLDILPKAKLIQLMNTGRDELFDIHGVYWTLIGRKGIGSIIETEAERVADYLSGCETYVGPLDFDKTRQIIDKRVATFRENESVKCPLTDEAIKAFYFLSVQELRETLRICSEITKKVLLIDPSQVVIPMDTAMQTFIGYAYDRAKELDLTDSKIRVLRAVYESDSCRPKDFLRYGYSSVQGFIAALKGLVKKRLLSIEERGRARIYRMTGMTMIAAVTGALGDEIQKIARARLEANGAVNERGLYRFETGQLELELDENNNGP